ncbi:unnamed protein product [Camellia sinensis]
MASSSDFETSSNNIPYQGLDCHDENVLKKHVEFFDRNKDGVVYPWETFQGFRAIGCNIFLSTFASIFINVGLSGKTRPGKCPSLCFPIVVKNIQKAKHGSDSGVYDSEGRFVPSKFEEIFCKHAHTNPNALTSAELKEMRKANREPKDYGGRMIYETSPSLREEKTEKTEPGSQTEAKHKRVRKSGGKARNRDSETSERVQYAISPSAQLVTSESQGRIGSFAEWTILYILCKDKNGLLQKDTIRGVYDGSLFEQMAEKKASAGKKKHTVTSE